MVTKKQVRVCAMRQWALHTDPATGELNLTSLEEAVCDDLGIDAPVAAPDWVSDEVFEVFDALVRMGEVPG